MTQKKISKKEAELLLKKTEVKPKLSSFIGGVTLLGLVLLGIAAAYKALIMYLFGG